MDTDSQSRRSMGIGAMAAHGFTAPDRDNPSRSPPLVNSEFGRVSALSASTQPVFDPLTQQGLIQLVGELSLRVIRSQRQP